MAITSGFFNSNSGDRKYDAIQLSSIFDGIITDGIFRSIGTSMKVLASTGMTVVVGQGRAWFKHTWTLVDADIPIVIDAADAIFDRIDIIALDINTDSGVRANSIVVLKGTPASTPVAPTLAQAGTHWQYPLCHILVLKNATGIAQGNITNKVGTISCPYITVIDAVLEMGDRQYTANNYVLDNQTITESINALDIALRGEYESRILVEGNLSTNKQNTITGGATSITGANLAANKALISDANGKVGVSPVTAIELGFLAGAASNIQAQLNSVIAAALTASRAVISDATGKLASSPVTAAELAFLSGAQSNIQQQLDSKTPVISGAATTIVSSNLAVNRALISDANGKVGVSPVTSVELGYLDGVTGAIQDQINNKQAEITGAASLITSNNLTIGRVLISDGSGKVAVSTITSAILAFLSGVTSDIQTQLNAKLGVSAQAADSLKVGGKKVTVGTSAPSSPAVGDIWIDTN